MTTARKVREAALCGMMLAGSMLALRASARHPADLNLLDRAILGISAPLQGAVSSVAHGVRRGLEHYVFVVGAAEENERLLRDNRRLRAALLAADRQGGRRSELERLLGLQLRVAAETAAARVVGLDTNAQFRVARIRLESGDAVLRPGMAVLAPEGVVGRIDRVYGAYSDVLLAVDAKSAIDVVVPRTGVRGMLRGAAGRDCYRAVLEFSAGGGVVAPEDVVVTSGLGGVFPRDVPVGRVVALGRREAGLFQEAQVDPIVDFAKLDVVLVLATPPPPGPEHGPTTTPSPRGVVPYQ